MSRPEPCSAPIAAPAEGASSTSWAEGDGVTLIEAALTAPLVALSQRWPRVLHAIEMEEVVKKWTSHAKTLDAVCGARRLKALVNANGRVVPWPPRVKGLPETYERCRECWIATGRKRPRTEYRSAS